MQMLAHLELQSLCLCSQGHPSPVNRLVQQCVLGFKHQGEPSKALKLVRHGLVSVPWVNLVSLRAFPPAEVCLEQPLGRVWGQAGL